MLIFVSAIGDYKRKTMRRIMEKEDVSMNDSEKNALIKAPATEESLKKSHGMITYISDLLLIISTDGQAPDVNTTKTYVTHFNACKNQK